MGTAGKVAGAIVALVLGGCSGGAPTRKEVTDNVAGVGGAAGSLPSGGGGSVGGSVGAGRGGHGGSPVGTGGGGAAGSSVGGTVGSCGTLALTAPLTLAPAATGQAYVRCGTLGPEAAWTVTLSPSGDRIAALTGAGTVRLIATDTWTDLAQLASPLGQIDAVAFSPDGATLATLSSEMGEVALWSATNGALVRAFAGPSLSGVDTISAALAFSSDGRRLATSLGTVIDLQSGDSTSWRTGQPSNSVLQLNPETMAVDNGDSVATLRFVAGDARLFVHATFQVGNSPPTTRLELRDPATGQAVATAYEMYTRALHGFALTGDGHYLAVGKDAEAAVGGFAPGLSVFDTTTGAQIAFDGTFTGTVLGFSPDGATLYTRNGTTVSAVATVSLQPIAQITWPADVVFLGVSPAGDLVGSVGGTTSWWNPNTGAIVRTANYPLAMATWSADGRFGAGTGDPASLFHFWREDGAQLCAPAADPTLAPPLASLGTPGPTQAGGSVTSADGAVTVAAAFVIHTHAADYDVLRVTNTATGERLRQFDATVDVQPIAISNPTGDRLYTPEGPDVAIWCR